MIGPSENTQNRLRAARERTARLADSACGRDAQQNGSPAQAPRARACAAGPQRERSRCRSALR